MSVPHPTDDFLEIVRTTSRLDPSPLVADWLRTTGWAERAERLATIDELEDYYRSAG